MRKKIPMIIVTTKDDYCRIKRDLGSFFDFLPISVIIFIGPFALKESVENDARLAGYSDKVLFMDENELLSINEVKDIFSKRLSENGYSMSGDSKPGWYYQQFLKMLYSCRCEDDYYISWDADTVPLRSIELFNDKGIPYFDVKREYIPSYFRTIENLLGLKRIIEASFISEHMVFSTDLMRRLISEIENKDVCGKKFYEKIIYSVSLNDMKLGFSEFETYGTWVSVTEPKAYTIREWKSLRKGGVFFENSELATDDLQWLARSYDAISFEKYHPFVNELAELFNNPDYRINMSAEEIYDQIVKSGIFGEYKDGMIVQGENCFCV